MANSRKQPRKQPRRGARHLINVPGYVSSHPQYAQCRIWSHPWNIKGAIEYRNGSVVWHLECGRCGAEQEMYTGRRTGEVESRRYHHSEGYIWEGVGQQKPRSGELRLALAGVLTAKKARTR